MINKKVKKMAHIITRQEMEDLNYSQKVIARHERWLEETLTINYADFEQEFDEIRQSIIDVHQLRTKLINDTVGESLPFEELSWQDLKKIYIAEDKIEEKEETIVFLGRKIRHKYKTQINKLPEFIEIHRHKPTESSREFNKHGMSLFPITAYDAWMEAEHFVSQKKSKNYANLSDITKNLQTTRLFDISRKTMLTKSADYDGAADRYASFKRSAETARYTNKDANVLSEILALRRKHGEWCVEFQAGNRPNATDEDIHEHFGDFFSYTVILCVWLKYSDFEHNKYKLVMVK